MKTIISVIAIVVVFIISTSSGGSCSGCSSSSSIDLVIVTRLLAEVLVMVEKSSICKVSNVGNNRICGN